METAQMEHVLDHTRPTDLLDAANPAYFDHTLGLDYLQYPDNFDMQGKHRPAPYAVPLA